MNSSAAPKDEVSREEGTIALIKDSITSIRHNAMRFLSGTALSRVSGMVRDMVLAFAFGTHEAIAALFVAFRLSHVCRRLFGEGALQSAFIPLFEELRTEAPVRAFRFFRDLTVLLTLFLISLVAVGMIGLGASLHFYEWSDKKREIIKLMIILLPSLIPICLFGVNSALLQCQKHYFTAGIAPAFFNIIITIGALFLCRTEPTAAMPYLAVSIVLGCVMQWLATFPATMRHMREGLKGQQANLSSMRHIRDFVIGQWTNVVQLFSLDIRRLGGPLALGFLGVGASQINNAVDTLFALRADPEGPAQLWYGLRLLQLPLALFGIAISGALLPPLSRSIQAGNEREYRYFMEFALRRVTAFLLPCTVALYAFGTHIINAIYGRGDFQAHSVFTTSGCLHGYALGLLPMGFIIVLAPAFYAHKDFRAPTIGAILSLLTNVVLDAFLVFVLQWGALSVALATSIAAWINIAYLYKRLRIHSGNVLSDEGGQEFLKVIAVSISAGIATWFCQTYFFVPASFFNMYANSSAALLPTDLFGQMLALALPGCTFLACIALFSYIINAQDILNLFRKQKNIEKDIVIAK